MPTKEIKELRQNGQLEEALAMAVSELEATPDNIWSKRNISWVYYEFLKKYVETPNFDLFKLHLLKIKELNLPETEKMLFDNSAWQVGKMVFHLNNQNNIDYNHIYELFQIIKEFHLTKPSDAYSFLLKAFHKAFKEKKNEGFNASAFDNGSRYRELIDWWGLENFQESDYHPEEFNNRKIMSLVEQVIIAYSKNVLRKINFVGLRLNDNSPFEILGKAVGVGGKIQIINNSNNFSNENKTFKRIHIRLTRKDNTCFDALCTENVSKLLLLKKVKLSNLINFEIVNEKSESTGEVFNAIRVPSSIRNNIENQRDLNVEKSIIAEEENDIISQDTYDIISEKKASNFYDIKDKLSSEIKKFLSFIDGVINNYSNYQYPLFYKAKLLEATGQSEEAINFLIPFVKRKKRDFWAWELLGELHGKGSNEHFACLCKALLLKTQDKFLIGTREAFANLLIEKAMYDEAKTEIEEIIRVRKQNDWKIPNSIQSFTEAQWYTNASLHKNNRVLYKKYESLAEELLYHNHLEETVIVEFVNESKKMLNFIKSRDFNGFFKYEGLLDKPKVGDLINIRYEEPVNKDDNYFKVFTAKKIDNEEVLNQLDAFKEEEGKIHILSGKSFGFVNDVFVPDYLVNKHKLTDKQTINIKALLSYNKAKKEWGYKCYALETT